MNKKHLRNVLESGRAQKPTKSVEKMSIGISREVDVEINESLCK